MGVISRYWQLVKIDPSGRRQIQEITLAKAFFLEMFPTATVNDDLPDAEINKKLLQLSQNAPADRCLLAERCLLCFISWQIEQVCLQLAAKFGTVHGFKCTDLLLCVLDDDGKLKPIGDYQSFSRQILQSFDPEKSNLTTWTNTRVKQNHRLNQFLLECGVYLVSDWAILNDTKPKQLQRIFREFYCFSAGEILQAQQLLESYHAIYRTARLEQLRKNKEDNLEQPLKRRGGKCTIPTIDQLQAIATLLQSKTNQTLSSETVMVQLQKLAEKLRQYRIYARGGSLPAESLDVVDPNVYDEGIAGSHNTTQAINDEDEQTEFLQLYRSQFMASLQQALAIVTQRRVEQLQRKKGDKAKKFLFALQLFHCQNLSMTEIAVKVGLRAQDAVTRFLKLKDFRADVGQELLIILCNSVMELAKNYSHSDSLQTLEEKINIALNEQINHVIEAAEIQAQTAKTLTPKTSIFNQLLCHYLDDIIS
ncbi:MAG: hypothetical protein ACKO11_16745 [Cuspidothrix sp.]